MERRIDVAQVSYIMMWYSGEQITCGHTLQDVPQRWPRPLNIGWTVGKLIKQKIFKTSLLHDTTQSIHCIHKGEKVNTKEQAVYQLTDRGQGSPCEGW